MVAVDKAPEAFRTISEVAEELNVPKHVLRFWEAKFTRNLARDQRTTAALEARGYRVIVIWECQTKRGAAEIREFLRPTFQP